MIVSNELADEITDEIILNDGGGYVILQKKDYIQFITEIEAKARELWPELFQQPFMRNYELVNRPDGSTDMVEL